jgi:FKBP-type peptidyl-prolyl cis-trans isomerase
MSLLTSGLAAAVLALQAVASPATQPAAVTTESGLIIQDQPAPAEPLVARKGDLVFVHYTGTLADGTVFDTSHKPAPGQQRGSPFSFVIGRDRVIEGWHQGIVGMTVGQKRKLIIPPALAYGADGRPPAIPPDATLTFEVELVGLYRDPADATEKP